MQPLYTDIIILETKLNVVLPISNQYKSMQYPSTISKSRPQPPKGPKG